ncbi:protein NRT1/ PTR FAMILY 5.6-like [Senna tora]|uniref:Protein NRT1/ PTR FAMILY 5.6-like n=1 Tax=Senna tora TaxID=362788 RepID=A0A834XGY8_9FABA|nr:protein NRT1/ PTR FAMILY 5.6-like [Senna tora]
MNLLGGVSAVFVVVVAHISEAYTAAYGLMLPWVSSWSFTEFQMAYVAVILIALGKAGKDQPLHAFFEYQLSKRAKSNSEINKNPKEQTNASAFWWSNASFCGATVAIYWIDKSSWRMAFKHSALIMAAMYLSFYSGIASYYPGRWSFIGLMEGLGEYGLGTFFYSHMPKSIWKFERYFLMLAILSFVFFGMYVYDSWRYNVLGDYKGDDDEEEELVTKGEKTLEDIQEAIQEYSNYFQENTTRK